MITATYNGPVDQHDVLMDKTMAEAFIRKSDAFEGKTCRVTVDYDEDLDLTDVFFIIEECGYVVEPKGRF